MSLGAKLRARRDRIYHAPELAASVPAERRGRTDALAEERAAMEAELARLETEIADLGAKRAQVVARLREMDDG